MTIREERERLLKAADYRCQCANEPGQAECGKQPHTELKKRCPNGAFVQVTEPNGDESVLCYDCYEDRQKVPGRKAKAAKAERAADYAARQTSLLDLITEEDDQ